MSSNLTPTAFVFSLRLLCVALVQNSGDDFGDSAIIIKVLGDTQPIKQWDVAGEFRKRIKIAFDREGIEIPFPQRVVHQVGARR